MNEFPKSNITSSDFRKKILKKKVHVTTSNVFLFLYRCLRKVRTYVDENVTLDRREGQFSTSVRGISERRLTGTPKSLVVSPRLHHCILKGSDPKSSRTSIRRVRERQDSGGTFLRTRSEELPLPGVPRLCRVESEVFGQSDGCRVSTLTLTDPDDRGQLGGRRTS